MTHHRRATDRCRAAGCLVLLALAVALAAPAQEADEVYLARLPNDSIEKVQVLAKHEDGTYDLILLRTHTHLRRVHVQELQPISAAGEAAGAGRDGTGSLPFLAEAAERELQTWREAATPGRKGIAERRLEETFEAVVRQARELSPDTVTRADVDAALATLKVAERYARGQHLNDLEETARRLRDQLVRGAVAEGRELAQLDDMRRAVERLNEVLPYVAGTTVERDYDQARGDAMIELSKELLGGDAAAQRDGAQLAQEAVNSPDPRTQARAAILLADRALQQGDLTLAAQWVEKARSLRGSLPALDHVQLDLLTARVGPLPEEPAPRPTRRIAAERPVAASPVRPAPGPAPPSPPVAKRSGWQLILDPGYTVYLYKKQDWARFGPQVGYQAGILLAGFYLLWVVPTRRYLEHMRRRRGFEVQPQAQIARLTGLPGVLLLYALEFFEKREQMLCPSCGGKLNNPKAFGDLQFEVCPFCGAKIKPMYTLEEYIASLTSTIETVHAGDAGAVTSEEQRSTMLTLISAIITHAIRQRASDIHLERDPARCVARFRVDGILHEALRFPVSLHGNLVAAIKTMAEMNVSERRMPQDGHFHHLIDDASIHVRVATIPTNLGEKMVLRLLDPRQAVLGTEKLGFSRQGLEHFERCLRSAHGMILTTGPTGSGKTTLLYAALSAVNDGRRSIFTIEDPIEYQLPGINQIQHNEATGLTFATALRSIMRQDPDIIMVGEIRDADTAAIAVRASLTGHLVFSTLHTIDAASAISRLVDIGVDARSVANATLCIVAQRLVRTICPKCAKPAQLTADQMAMLRVKSVPDNAKILAGEGCDNCGGTGFIGRTGIYEVLVPDARIRALMDSNASVQDIRAAAIATGMRTLRQEAVVKLYQGVTTIDEVLRVTADLDEDRVQAPSSPPGVL